MELARDQPVSRLFRKRLNGNFDIRRVEYVGYDRLNPKRQSGGIECLRIEGAAQNGGLWIDQESDAHQSRHDLLENPKPFARKRRFEQREAGDIAAGTRQARHISGADGVRCADEHNRNSAGLTR